ncbi:polyadenylate-binding protein-interacting protein 6-like isoform X2 [Salvia splendens]|nr:polyadenylate-binding protein-interacting protein 6-like isoform X2 [Salvia splendens]XP_041995446.1 polyadenylate-binding protein-interacting protein 6-like isoform X2 [Salvia splendens]
MKTGSSLNPNAAAYVPLFKRGSADVNKEFGSPEEFNSENEVGQFGYRQNVILRHSQIAGAPQTAEYPKWKYNYRDEYVASTSQYPEKPGTDEDSDIDLTYMQMNFPGISLESLSDVYQASGCDLDSAIDMVHQLEIMHVDSSDKLPDTLDIGDIPDSAPVKAPLEAMNATSGASTSVSSDIPAKS